MSQGMQGWFSTEWAEGRLTRPRDAIISLLRAPEEFLRKYPIINTFDCAAHGTTLAYLRNDRADAKRPGSRLGTKRLHTTESFNLESVSGANQYGARAPVHGVHMTQSSAGPAWYRLDGHGPAMMLTAKLTGCTFVARAAAGQAVEVTHLQPHQEDGLQLNRRMRGGGRSAYGRLKYNLETRSINVIGVRSGARWKIWAQKIEKNGTVPTIRSVKRIWPV